MAKGKRGTPAALHQWARNQTVAVKEDESRVFRLITEGLVDATVVTQWHAGQALAAGLDWATEAHQTAQDDCDARMMATAYRVELYDPNTERSLAGYPMRFTPEEQGVEGASAEGIVMQVLRHKEAMMRMTFSAMHGVMREQSTQSERQGKVFGDIVDRLAKRLEVSEQMQLKAMETWAAAMEALHEGAEREEERDDERRRARKLEELMDEGVGVLKMKALGAGQPAPESAKNGSDSAKVESIFRPMRPVVAR